MRVCVCGEWRDCEPGTTYYDLAREKGQIDGCDILLASDRGRLRELGHTVREGSEVSFLTARETAAYETYRRSVIMLFEAAVSHLRPGNSRNATLHFTLGSGFYLTLDGEVEISKPQAGAIEAEMRRMVDLAIPFTKRSVATSAAIRLFHDKGMYDKEKLFHTRIASRVNIYSLDDYEDYYYGYMVHDTSVLGLFEVLPYEKGFILNLPKKGSPNTLTPWAGSKKLFMAQITGELWAEQQGIDTVADLNERIIYGGISNTVLTAEAMQESGIAKIAETISKKKGVKFVMIAGPSSSGKTTFSQRLCVQLSAHGMKPHYMGVDNYFRSREEMEPGPDGKLDFEALTAVDVKQFNSDLSALLRGETIRVPTFDFIEGRRVYTGETLKFSQDDLLVIEGIHCLNDALSYELPKESKYRIYLSALTQINVDEHNRVSSADGRLIRRIVRDNRTRGYSAAKTLALWDMVREGEERNIFPFQDSADIFFNSALPYELAALKTYVTPLLFQVTEEDPGFLEAKRLLKFLDYILPIPADDIPGNSILREFIGGGCYHL